MDNRQAIILSLWITTILAWISACAPINTPAPVPEPTIPLTATQPTAAVVESTPTPKQCQEQRGQVERRAFPSIALPQYTVYLPPCYDFDPKSAYPILYLLHGASFTDEQWIRLGATEKADELISAGEIPPLIIVMPYDKYSTHLVDDDEFGEVFIEEFLPYIDETYRTDPARRAIGGLSRGAGWAIDYGLTRYELFSAIGGHSAAIFKGDESRLDNWLAEIPAEQLPAIYLDAGDQDPDWRIALAFADLLNEMGIPHEWRFFTGSHDEEYWRAHLSEYLRWYGNILQ